MRDVVLLAIIIWIVLVAWRSPWLGILGWTWVSVMNPHQLSWALKTLPVAAAIGGSTLVGFFISGHKRDFSLVRENATLLIFMLWMSICVMFSMVPDESYELWTRIMKIDLMVLVTIAILHSKRHIMLFTWVMTMSLAFYGIKGGLFTLATGGSYRVWGPEGTYIEGNNEVALALVMAIPLLRFLQTTLTLAWARHMMTVFMVLCAFASLGSHSRGALLALFSMGTVMWWRGKHKFWGAFIFIIVGIALLQFMPAEWWSRMNTIKTYEEDDSAMGRINAWWMAFNLAKANFFGGGFMIYLPHIFALYAPNPADVHAAHSIYFMVLGETGFIGLFLFLALLVMTYMKFGRIRKLAKKYPEAEWMGTLGAMGQVSLVGYFVGGTFLSLSYWDMPYNLMALAVISHRWIEKKSWVKEKPERLLQLPNWMLSWLPNKVSQHLGDKKRPGPML